MLVLFHHFVFFFYFLFGHLFASLPSILLRWKGKDYFNMEGRFPGIELSVFVIPTLDLLTFLFLGNLVVTPLNEYLLSFLRAASKSRLDKTFVIVSCTTLSLRSCMHEP